MQLQNEQLAAFQQDAWRRYEGELVQHIQSTFAMQAALLGAPQLNAIVRNGAQRAVAYGFTARGAIRLFVELMFLCGSAFDSDPQYVPIAAPLFDSDHEMLRAQRMHERHTAYLQQIEDPSGEPLDQAQRTRAALAQGVLAVSGDDFDYSLFSELERIHPRTLAYMGEENVRRLIQHAKQQAAVHGLTTARSVAAVAFLVFFFGHGCTVDPIYPWIAATLQDEKLGTPDDRAQRLENMAVTWLEQVIQNESAGSRS